MSPLTASLASPGIANALMTRLRKPSPQLRSWREGGRETRGAPLPGVDIGPQARFVSDEGFMVLPARIGEFACQHVGENRSCCS